ncbi:MAG: MGMT family protein, partial [Nanoarchaeota archaeon]
MKKGFTKRVYKICKKIPKGKVSTYKIIAEALGTR